VAARVVAVIELRAGDSRIGLPDPEPTTEERPA
jgi:hypothetical protein